MCVCVDQCCQDPLSNYWIQALNWKVIRRFYLLGCTAVQSSGIVPMVRGIMLPPSSTWRWKQYVSASRPRRRQSSQFRPVELQNWHMFGFGLFYCEVGVVPRLLAGRPVNRGTIPGGDKLFVSASKLPDLPWSSHNLLFSGVLFVFGVTAPIGPGPPHSRGFKITLRHTTLGRTLLDEWSAHPRDFYLTTYITHNRQTCIPPVGFEITILAGERPQTYALDRAATWTGPIEWAPKFYPGGEAAET